MNNEEIIIKNEKCKTVGTKKCVAKKGITLIALVITIIVMLILAGITIGLTLGDRGILKMAENSGKTYENANKDEKNDLDSLYSSMLIATNDSSQVTISIQDLKTIIQEEIKNSNVTSVPAGTIISYMGNNAPTGYLFCDGTEYNILDYPNLAEQIKTEFGSYNHYGGDGATTFAVPDLRGEFLRGTGTATRDTGTGASVGTHQDATKIPYYLFTPNQRLDIYGSSNSGDYISVAGYDKKYLDGTMYAAQVKSDSEFTSTSTATYNIGSVRPTNTSVLYCIKY